MAQVNWAQVSKVAEFLKANPSGSDNTNQCRIAFLGSLVQSSEGGHESDSSEKAILDSMYLPLNTPEAKKHFLSILRIVLRLGLVDLTPKQNLNIQCKIWLTSADEAEVLYAVFGGAVSELVRQSGLSVDVVDEAFLAAMEHCENDKPKCSKCILMSVCERRTSLFSPVLRFEQAL